MRRQGTRRGRQQTTVDRGGRRLAFHDAAQQKWNAHDRAGLILVVTAADDAGWQAQRVWQEDYRPALGLLPGDDGDWPDLARIALPRPPGGKPRPLWVVDDGFMLRPEHWQALAKRARTLGIQPVLTLHPAGHIVVFGRFAEGTPDARLLGI